MPRASLVDVRGIECWVQDFDCIHETKLGTDVTEGVTQYILEHDGCHFLTCFNILLDHGIDEFFVANTLCFRDEFGPITDWCCIQVVHEGFVSFVIDIFRIENFDIGTIFFYIVDDVGGFEDGSHKVKSNDFFNLSTPLYVWIVYIMYSSVANTTFSYLLTLDEFRRTFPSDKMPSWVKITTITMISGFSEEVKIDIEKIKSLFADPDESMKKFQSGVPFNWSLKTSTTFYNQVTLTYTDTYSTKSIKIFPNGSIQVAGCSDLFDCQRIIKNLNIFFKDVLGLENELSPETFRVVMINSNFSLNYNVNLHLTAQHFEMCDDLFEVSFEPDRYSAVKIKFKPAEDMKRITTSIFSTGKVIITGAETLKEIAFAYNIINHHINECQDIRVSPTQVTDVFDVFMGYKCQDLIQELKKKDFHSWTKTIVNNQINF